MDNRRHTARCDRRIRRSTQIHLEIFGPLKYCIIGNCYRNRLARLSVAQMLTFR